MDTSPLSTRHRQTTTPAIHCGTWTWSLLTHDAPSHSHTSRRLSLTPPPTGPSQTLHLLKTTLSRTHRSPLVSYSFVTAYHHQPTPVRRSPAAHPSTLPPLRLALSSRPPASTRRPATQALYTCATLHPHLPRRPRVAAFSGAQTPPSTPTQQTSEPLRNDTSGRYHDTIPIDAPILAALAPLLHVISSSPGSVRTLCPAASSSWRNHSAHHTVLA
jgi:hypothetical protein